MYKIDTSLDIISQLRSFNLKKIWRSDNKLDMYISNYFRTQTEYCSDLITWLIITADLGPTENIAVSAFIHLDFSLFIRLIEAGFSFNYSNVGYSYLISKVFKYSCDSSLYLKLKYLKYINPKLISAYCIIYADYISEKYIKLIMSDIVDISVKGHNISVKGHNMHKYRLKKSPVFKF